MMNTALAGSSKNMGSRNASTAMRTMPRVGLPQFDVAKFFFATLRVQLQFDLAWDRSITYWNRMDKYGPV